MDRRYNRPCNSDPYYSSPYCTANNDRQQRRPQQQRRQHRTRSVSPPPSLPPSPPASQTPPQRESMASWLSRTASSNEAKFAATAVASGALVAGAILGFQALRRQERVEDLKSSIPELGRDHHTEKLTDYGAASPTVGLSKEDERSLALAERAQQGDYDDDLILEQLARNRVFLTDAGLQKLRSAFVIVVGCGGVGSHCAAALARSGVSLIRLVDFDQVTLSSLNRHAVATLADVGTPKVQCLRRRLQQVTPWVRFDCRNELFAAAAADALLGPWDAAGDGVGEGRRPDYVVDAIDNIDSKVALLAYCARAGLEVISSMGAGCKSDPTRIFIGDISASTDDALSRSTRRRLRALGVASGIPVVFSTERAGGGGDGDATGGAKAALLPLPDEEFARGRVGELGVLPGFRARILPVLGTMPASFGLAAANHVMLRLAGYPAGEYAAGKARDKMYDGALAQLQGAEEKLARRTTPGEDARGLRLAVSAADVGYVIEEMFRGRSALSGVATRLALVRWRAPLVARQGEDGSTVDRGVPGQKTSKLRLRDLVCLTKEEAAVHEKEIVWGGKSPEEVYDEETVQRVEARIAEEIEYEKYR